MDKILSDKIKSLSDNITTISAAKRFLESRLDECDSKIKSSEYSIELCNKIQQLFKSWLEESIDKNINSISELTTNGLKQVIDDQDIQFKIIPEQKGGRLCMRFAVEHDGVEGDPLSNFGGGASAVIAVILRLSIMSRLSMNKLLILDESLSALANAYVPNAADLLRNLSSEMGINILMVTHNPEFLDRSNISYEGILKDGSLKLNKF
jgi:DNA repair exonuclease SbcCD ATPase subunit